MALIFFRFKILMATFCPVRMCSASLTCGGGRRRGGWGGSGGAPGDARGRGRVCNGGLCVLDPYSDWARVAGGGAEQAGDGWESARCAVAARGRLPRAEGTREMTIFPPIYAAQRGQGPPFRRCLGSNRPRRRGNPLRSWDAWHHGREDTRLAETPDPQSLPQPVMRQDSGLWADPRRLLCHPRRMLRGSPLLHPAPVVSSGITDRFGRLIAQYTHRYEHKQAPSLLAARPEQVRSNWLPPAGQWGGSS